MAASIKAGAAAAVVKSTMRSAACIFAATSVSWCLISATTSSVGSDLNAATIPGPVASGPDTRPHRSVGRATRSGVRG